jgi:hypothetical protein
VMVVVVSCTVTCGTAEPIDVVLNSLAFTFISGVSRFFNQPLLTFYSKQRILGLDEEVYGDEPIYYLVTSYSDDNAGEHWADSWYVREDQPLAGLLTDFRFRHNPGDYPRRNEWLIRALRALYLAVPFLSVGTCWALYTHDQGAAGDALAQWWRSLAWGGSLPEMAIPWI